jgi:hypothetical protein
LRFGFVAAMIARRWKTVLLLLLIALIMRLRSIAITRV